EAIRTPRGHYGERRLERPPGGRVGYVGGIAGSPRLERRFRPLPRTVAPLAQDPAPHDGTRALSNLGRQPIDDHATSTRCTAPRSCERAHAMIRLLIHPRVLADGTATGS